MKILKIAFKRETAMPMLALTFGSGMSFALVVARIFFTRNLGCGFLLWNLFLAWLPLIFALLASDNYRTTSSGRNWRFLSFAGAWLLFFPNAPYIFTDLIHLKTHFFRQFWIDLVLILLCALTGLVLGFVSLYLMQSVVSRILGRAASWLFIAGVAGLGSFGIYLGRFLRFNSWDILFKPMDLYHGIGRWAADPMANPTSFVFPMLFGTFLFIAYVMLYGLTHLQPAMAAPMAQRT
jgi:uncharacterized membrane protein